MVDSAGAKGVNSGGERSPGRIPFPSSSYRCAENQPSLRQVTWEATEKATLTPLFGEQRRPLSIYDYCIAAGAALVVILPVSARRCRKLCSQSIENPTSRAEFVSGKSFLERTRPLVRDSRRLKLIFNLLLLRARCQLFRYSCIRAAQRVRRYFQRSIKKFALR